WAYAKPRAGGDRPADGGDRARDPAPDRRSRRGELVQDRPTAVELLDALGGFMRDRVDNARDRWERFQFQVAANSIGIIKREVEMEDGFMRSEWQGLNRILGTEGIPEGQSALTVRLSRRNVELADRIRRGDFDGEAEDALLSHLWETVVNKVRIAN